MSTTLFTLHPSLRPPPRSTLFPYTTLFRSLLERLGHEGVAPGEKLAIGGELVDGGRHALGERLVVPRRHVVAEEVGALDRKSTRLNSSHMSISYAVFCLKKKKNHNTYIRLK